MGDAPVMGDAPAPPGPPPRVMGNVPSPPRAQGQVVGSETPRTECARTLASYATNDAKDEVTNANATNDKVAAKDGSYAARRQAEAKQRMRDKRKASAAALGRPSSILIVVVVVVVVLVSSLTFALRSEMWENRRLGRQ